MPYVLKTALAKIHDKPFNFVLIIGTQKQILLVSPKPPGKTLLDEAKATAVKGEKEGKGICKKVNDQYIFLAKTVTGGLRTGIKLAMNNNNCKTISWDLQALGANESDEVMTEDTDETPTTTSTSSSTSASQSTSSSTQTPPTQAQRPGPTMGQRPPNTLGQRPPPPTSPPPQQKATGTATPPPTPSTQGRPPNTLGQRPPPPTSPPPTSTSSSTSTQPPPTQAQRPPNTLGQRPPPPTTSPTTTQQEQKTATTTSPQAQRPPNTLGQRPPPPTTPPQQPSPTSTSSSTSTSGPQSTSASQRPTTPTTTSTTSTTPQSTTGNDKKSFDDRFNRIGRDYVKAHNVATDKDTLEKLFTEAGAQAKNKNWIGANKALDTLEPLITSALTTSTTTAPKVDPRMGKIIASETEKMVGAELKTTLQKQIEGLQIQLTAIENAKPDPGELKKLQTSVAQSKQKLNAIKPEGDFSATQKEIGDLEKTLATARRTANENQFKKSQTANDKTVYDHLMAPVGSTRKHAFQKGDADRYEKEMGKLTGTIQKGVSAEYGKMPKPTAAELEDAKKLKDAQATEARIQRELDDAWEKSGKKTRMPPQAKDKMATDPSMRDAYKAVTTASINENLATELAPLNKEFQNILASLKKLEGSKNPSASDIAKLQQKASDLITAIDAQVEKTRTEYLEYVGVVDPNDPMVQPIYREIANSIKTPESTHQIQACQSIILESKMRDASLKSVFAAQRKVEADKSRTNIEALIKECDNFLAPLNSKEGANATRSKELQKKEENARFILKYARILLIGLESDKLGPPPWTDDSKRAKASELEVQLFFEENPLKQRARQEGSTASGTWFVERIAKDKEGKRTREGATRDKGGLNDVYIFKPIDAEPNDPNLEALGWKKGGGAPREVISKSVNDSIQRATGLNIGVCETSLIALDTDKLPDTTGAFANTGPKRPGALQHMTSAKGPIASFISKGRGPYFDKMPPKEQKAIIDAEKKEREFFETVPNEDYSKIALFDMLTLQMDRHADNILVSEDSEGNNRLVPIDHGLSLPDKKTFLASRTRMEGPGNVLSNLPQKDTLMDPTVLKGLESINPDEIEADMRRSYNTMKTEFPGTDGAFGKNEESFTLVKRSAIFLKRAAPKLTMGDLFSCYSGDPNLFLKVIDAKDNEINSVIDGIIAEKLKARAEKITQRLDPLRQKIEALDTKAQTKFMPMFRNVLTLSDNKQIIECQAALDDLEKQIP